ncbi:MAG TPA: universal stress protein [Gaiellaceae bacterium]|jgi:nucleotide-binding universal stress UspA family protein|nr:universal stress protein [Gaiellaceae bacterium]
MYRTIMWATDGSAGAAAALPEALRLLEPDGRLIAFHARQLFISGHASGLPVYPDEPMRIACIEQQVEDLRGQGVDAELLVESTLHSPVSAIAEAAEEAEVDAIVCSSRMHHALLRLLEASVSSRLIHEVSVPVIVVPQSVGVRAEAPA